MARPGKSVWRPRDTTRQRNLGPAPFLFPKAPEAKISHALSPIQIHAGQADAIPRLRNWTLTAGHLHGNTDDFLATKMKDMPRFKPPTASSEIAVCQGCNEPKHYTALNDRGFCQECQPRELCERCNGRGEIYNATALFAKCALTFITCPDCKGTGEK